MAVVDKLATGYNNYLLKRVGRYDSAATNQIIKKWLTYFDPEGTRAGHALQFTVLASMVEQSMLRIENPHEFRSFLATLASGLHKLNETPRVPTGFVSYAMENTNHALFKASANMTKGERIRISKAAGVRPSKLLNISLSGRFLSDLEGISAA